MGTSEPKLGAVRLKVPREDAVRRVQQLFLDGRQINTLYICADEEYQTAEKRKLSWVALVHTLLEQLCESSDAVDFFDDITLNVVQDSDPVELRAEQFHNELNQRLERLRVVRKAMEETPNSIGGTTMRRPAAPIPQPVASPAPTSPAVPSPTEQTGASSPDAVHQAEVKQVAKPSAPKTPVSQTKIMLVMCSRNGTARQALARFAAQMNLTFEIIDYNPDEPHAIIELIYRHRDAKFAVVYWGEPTGKELPGVAHPERYVGFSLGFALGRLGRGRVFIMGSTTTPPLPGFTRILVSQLDSGGGWQIQLARRMKSAGVDIDLNRLT